MRNKVLVVDDIPMNCKVLAEVLKDEYDVVMAYGGESAVETLEKENDNIAIVLLDVMMPEVSGYDVLRYMDFNDLLKDIPVILITASDSDETEEEGLRQGAVDYIRKPFSPGIVRRRVKTMTDLYRYQNDLENLIAEKTEALSDINETIVAVLTSVMETKTRETKGHIQRIRLYTRELLKYVYEFYDDNFDLTPQKIEMMSVASILHDVGELMIPEAIVNKVGERTPEEEELFEQHTTKGCQLIEPLRNIENEFYTSYCYNICRYHHERWDGSGYPDKLSGNNIPICAQAVGLVHDYDELMCKYDGSHPKTIEALLVTESQKFSPILTETMKLIGMNLSEVYQTCQDK